MVSAVCTWVWNTRGAGPGAFSMPLAFWANLIAELPGSLPAITRVYRLLFKDPPAGFPKCKRIAIFFERRCFFLNDYS